MFYGIISLCGILSFLSIRSSFYPLKWIAGFSWWGMLVYWIQADLVVDGTPTDVIFMLLFIGLGVLFVLWGMAARNKVYDIEVSMDKEGSVIGKVYKSMAERKVDKIKTRETAEEYRQRVHRARTANRKKR